MVFFRLLRELSLSPSNRLRASVSAKVRWNMKLEKRRAEGATGWDTEERESSEWYSMLTFAFHRCLSLAFSFIFIGCGALHSIWDVRKFWSKTTAVYTATHRLISANGHFKRQPRARQIQSHRRDFAQLFSRRTLCFHLVCLSTCTKEIWLTHRPRINNNNKCFWQNKN